jgi:hypothetical protein
MPSMAELRNSDAPTAASHVWHNSAILQRICCNSSDATLSRIIRVHRQSFDAGVVCLWRNIPEAIHRLGDTKIAINVVRGHVELARPGR